MPRPLVPMTPTTSLLLAPPPARSQFTVPTVPAPAGDNENQIRSVNVYLGARSTTTAATTGKYVRTNLATQVALRSMAYFNTY